MPFLQADNNIGSLRKRILLSLLEYHIVLMSARCAYTLKIMLNYLQWIKENVDIWKSLFSCHNRSLRLLEHVRKLEWQHYIQIIWSSGRCEIITELNHNESYHTSSKDLPSTCLLRNSVAGSFTVTFLSDCCTFSSSAICCLMSSKQSRETCFSFSTAGGVGAWATCATLNPLISFWFQLPGLYKSNGENVSVLTKAKS